jgi:hypothetical protein
VKNLIKNPEDIFLNVGLCPISIKTPNSNVEELSQHPQRPNGAASEDIGSS